MRRFPLGPCLGLTLLASAAPSAAHHSFAMFDRDRTVALAGTVKAFQIMNPHGWLRILAPAPEGSQAEWSIELGGPGQVARMGLTEGPEAYSFFNQRKDGVLKVALDPSR